MTAPGGSVVGGDRRAARRQARRAALLGAAMRIVARDGIATLTMQGVADEGGCAVGTVYTHFASKGALVAELQNDAVRRIVASLQEVRDRSRTLLDESGAAAPARAAADVVLFGEFVIACWDAFPEESHLLLSVLAERGEVVPCSEPGAVFGTTVVLLVMGRDSLDAAVATEVVEPGPSMDRVVIGASTLLGVLLTSHVSHVDPVAFDHLRLTRSAWRTLLAGWGMAPDVLAAVDAHLADLAATGPLAPEPETW